MSILRHFNKHHGWHDGKRTPFGGGGGGGIPIISPIIKAVGSVVSFAVSIVSSIIVSKPKIPDTGNQGIDNPSSNSITGNRQQIPPASNNKLPVIYGTAWVGGTITDLSITSNNQTMYYVLSLSEVTNTQTGSAPDTFTFGNMYYGGKRCVFDTIDRTRVVKLIDESTGAEETAIDGNLFVYQYSNGSNNPANSSQSAISVMSDSNLIYKWDSTKLMSNAVFVIVKLNYNSAAGVTSLQQTKFQISNSRSAPGDCFTDYLQSTRYGAAIPSGQINGDSFQELNSYSNELFSYTTFAGTTSTIKRFEFDGLIDTSKSIQSNMQIMADCCDCLIKYNEITAKWGVITQKPTVTPVMDINDSNMISAVKISPLDTSATYNIAEVYFAENLNQDSFSSVTFDLASINPSLLYQNEPVNKQNITLSLVNDNVRAQYLATRFLEACREDLIVQVSVMFVGLQLEAGDIVTMTLAKYGWEAKLFRINQVKENFNADGTIVIDLNLNEFNPLVFDDKNITQFTPAPNSGIGSATAFGTVPAPVIASTTPSGASPSVTLAITSSSAGISQYAEVWYSAYSNPTSSQRIFAGTTAIQSNGTPYDPSSSMGNVTVSNLPPGNWYFFSRMVNSVASSVFSPASSVLDWRPTTVQYSSRYLVVAYADSLAGTGFTTNPRGKAFFGVTNQTSSSPVTNPALYTWYAASPTFGTDNFLLFINRGDRKFSFATGQADYAAVTGSFVPTDFATYDPSLWSGLPDGTNYIDLDHRTGQLTETGTTTVGSGEIKVTNNADGKVVASLSPLLSFGGPTTYTASVAKLTIDIYGRVLGFEPPDDFNYTMVQFTASAGQTLFHVTRGLNYLIDNCWVFQNGVLLDQSEYTDTAGSTGDVTLAVGADIYDIITIVSFKPTNLITGSYNAFSVNYVDLVSANSYTASGFTLVSGYELLFLNGTVVNEQDYDIVGQTITNFPSLVTGRLAIYQWTQNNLGVPAGTAINVVTNSVIGQDTYPFSYVAGALNIYQNGVLLDEGTDYTAGFGDYVLANTPTDVNQILLQQTFDRTGAV